MEWLFLVVVVVVLAAWLFTPPGKRPDRTERVHEGASQHQGNRQRTVRGARVREVAVPSAASKRSQPPAETSGGGILGYHGLLEWWHTEFTEEERQYIDRAFQPMGFSNRGLEHGDIQHSSQSSVSFLSSLAGWFGKRHERPLAYRILTKAEEVVDDQTPVLDRHFLYGNMIKLYYKDRTEKMDKAIEACRKQIEMGQEAAAAFKANDRFSIVPSHPGFHQLAIVLEKRGDLEEVIELCQRADQQGWAGDWERRIERCRKKLSKQG